MGDKATAPLDLLRELKNSFMHDALAYRDIERDAEVEGDRRAAGAKAYANETVVRKIDATLRDWA